VKNVLINLIKTNKGKLRLLLYDNRNLLKYENPALT